MDPPPPLRPSPWCLCATGQQGGPRSHALGGRADRWLIGKGKMAEAEESLQLIRSATKPVCAVDRGGRWRRHPFPSPALTAETARAQLRGTTDPTGGRLGDAAHRVARLDGERA